MKKTQILAAALAAVLFAAPVAGFAAETADATSTGNANVTNTSPAAGASTDATATTKAPKTAKKAVKHHHKMVKKAAKKADAPVADGATTNK